MDDKTLSARQKWLIASENAMQAAWEAKRAAIRLEIARDDWVIAEGVAEDAKKMMDDAFQAWQLEEIKEKDNGSERAIPPKDR